MINLLTRACVLAGVFVIAGCSTHSQSPQNPVPVTTKPTGAVTPNQPALVQPQPGAVPKPVPTVALNPAAQSLAKQARQQYLAQDYQGAIATAERGLRIERRAADLYLVLAQSYVQLALPDKAKMFVQQGLRFAAPGSDTAQGLTRVQEMVDQSN
jgi:hypothetical protein